MNHRTLLRFGLSLTCVTLTTCTHTRVTKVTAENPNPKGFRYHLPQPFLLVTPKPNGTLSVERIFLPDESNEYAITSNSVLAKNKFQVDISEELLDKIVTNANTAVIPSKAAGAAATTLQSSIEAKAAAEQERAEAAQAAETAVDKAKLDLEIANNALEAARAADPQNQETIAAARLAVEDARTRLSFATRAMESALSSSAETKTMTTPAQVLYRVVDDGESVRLVAVNYRIKSGKGQTVSQQPSLDTSKKDSPDPPKLEIWFKGEGAVIPDPKTGAMTLTLVSNRKSRFSNVKVTRKDDPGDEIDAVAAPQLDGVTLVISFLEQPSPGRYIVEVSVKPGNEPAVQKELEFGFQRKPAPQPVDPVEPP